MRTLLVIIVSLAFLARCKGSYNLHTVIHIVKTMAIIDEVIHTSIL